MNLDDYFDRLADNDVRIRGTRVGIETVLLDYLDGATAEEIALRYRSLSLEQVYATITYYWRKRSQVDSYLQAYITMSDERHAAQTVSASPLIRRLRALKTSRRTGSAYYV